MDRRALLLSVGYGQGHHAAARALAERLAELGWQTRTADVCELAHPRIFRLTQRFYHFCVRRAPWLWGITYAQTDTADWSRQVTRPVIRDCTRRLRDLLRSYRPQIVFCTYPLFAYMLDYLAEHEGLRVPYALVVTDAIEISRPWMLSKAPLVCVPDEYSAHDAVERYALPPKLVYATGFPVRRDFARCGGCQDAPDESNLHILYGAFCSIRRCRDEIVALLRRFPRCRVTVLAGERLKRLTSALKESGVDAEVSERLVLMDGTDCMHELFAQAHLYVGKAGAATVFEAYAAELPVIVNYSLPGQEQGNLELLRRDACGLYAEGPSDMLRAVEHLLADRARNWHRIRARMRGLKRSGGAPAIIDLALKRFVS